MFDCIMFQGNKIKKEVNEGKNEGKMKEKMGEKKKRQVGNGLEPPWTTFFSHVDPTFNYTFWIM